MICGLDSAVVYTVIVGLVAVERLFEMALGRRNMKRAMARGGVRYGQGHWPWMVLLHTTFLVACPAEVWLAERPFAAAQFWGFGGLVVLTMSLRYWVIATLGDRWNPQIVVVPDDVRITGGPFRYLPHPNYLAVVVELFALPMMHGAWGVAITYGVANGVLLRTRVLEEERVLQAELRTA